MKLNNIVAVQGEGQSNYLGYLAWYGLSDALFSRDTLRAGLKDAGLGEEWLPKEIRLPDAFRRATKDIECKRYSDQEGIHFNFLIREVAYDEEMIQRNIVCETVDKNGRRLQYDPSAATLVLNKKNGTIDVTAFTTIAEELANEAKNLFHQYRDNYSSQSVRQMIYGVIKSMSSTPVRSSGGVYFVPNRFETRLKNLHTFINLLEGGSATIVPVINAKESKDMIRQGLTDHLKSVLESCNNGIKLNKPKHHLKPLLDDAKRVVSDFKEYESILFEDVENMKTYIDLIRQQVKLMLDRMSN